MDQTIDKPSTHNSTRKKTANDDNTAKSFDQFNLDQKILKNLEKQLWHYPSEVQSHCLENTLQGDDILALAQTGTGKTGVFLITIAQKILTMRMNKLNKNNDKLSKNAKNNLANIHAIILAPTRELAIQIYEDSKKILQNIDINSTYIIGGLDIEKQRNILKSKKIDIVIATPGRLYDFVQSKTIALHKIKIWVCDEVDQMFNIGFRTQVFDLMSKLSHDCHKMMFSATINEEIEKLCFDHLVKNPQFIYLSQDNITPEKITQIAILCNSATKLRVLLALICSHKPFRAIVFTNTKINANWLYKKLLDFNFNTDLITGDLPQKKRISLIKKIKSNKINILIATDVASRGLHIPKVTHVYNFDLPQDPANYIHRIGRTARAGDIGHSFSLICDQYGQHLIEINKLLKKPLKCEWYPKEYLKPDYIAKNIPKHLKKQDQVQAIQKPDKKQTAIKTKNSPKAQIKNQTKTQNKLSLFQKIKKMLRL